MAAKNQTHFVITANRLSDGQVVYLTADDRWSESFDDGETHAAEATRDPRLAWAKRQERVVCGVYALELSVAPDGARMLSARERLRALGPADARRRLGYAP